MINSTTSSMAEKFDRQIRLWGLEGQAILSSSRVCIVGRCLLSQEILKDLKLLGLDRITLVCEDKSADESIEELEKQENFLNADGKDINYVLWDKKMMEEPSFWWNFDIIVVTALSFARLELLDKMSLPPMLVAFCDEFDGYLRFVSQEPHFVLHSHRQYAIPDLRLDRPWNDLENALKSLAPNASSLDTVHTVPYAAIIYSAVQDLREAGTRVTRDNIRECISTVQVSFGPSAAAVNFAQAKKFAYLGALNSLSIPENIEKCLSFANVPIKLPVNREIQALVRILHKYLKSEHALNQLPVEGSIPDMDSSTENYNRLKSVYQRKAAEDIHWLEKIASQEKLDFELTYDVLTTFCRNIHSLRVMEPSRSALTATYSPHAAPIEASYYEILQKLQKKQIGAYIPPTIGLPAPAFYSMMSITAGLTVQELAKILTHQFVPVENTFLFNGLTNDIHAFKT
ncbi:LAMI_0F12860g1_1 [Lachancea mirantina]|uniref:LAMI_0F12860g1_1 n=1 Tax=Lachancea mirantina TaxID=1230905 RepID=A0A1G4K373_9SACH|nr:LAMI_0F12860g1_1 [Lachancea mirantina]